MAGGGEQQEGVVDRARDDVAAGRLWKARDRLSAAARNSPADQEILSLLGEVHFQMGDQPAAWRFWALTERTGPDTDAAEAAFGERFGSDLANRLGQIPAREPLGDYPGAVRARLIALRADARAAGVDWPRPAPEPKVYSRVSDDDEGGSGCALLFGLALLGPWILGLVALGYLLIGLL